MSFQQQVLGTIISSVLNYDQLCQQMGESPAISTAKSTYAPCDGRSIVGSQLEIKTQHAIKNTPDLRGKFIRGLNVIYSVGQPLPFDSANFGDPQDNRIVMDYQPDQFKQHSHMYIGRFQEAEGGGGFRGHGFSSNSNPHDQNFDSSSASTGGGDFETRPRNISVYFYIKIN